MKNIKLFNIEYRYAEEDPSDYLPKYNKVAVGYGDNFLDKHMDQWTEEEECFDTTFDYYYENATELLDHLDEGGGDFVITKILQ